MNESPAMRFIALSALRTLYQVCTVAYGIGLLLLGFWSRFLSHQSQVIVLGYHSVGNTRLHISMPVADFDRQMRWLQRRSTPVLTIEQLINFITLRHPLSQDSVLVTFDDGFRDNLTQALPILRRCNLAAVFFVPTFHVGDYYTWDGNRGSRQHRILSWDDVLSLAAQGQQIGSHGVTHARFSDISPRDVEWELRESAAAIEGRLGQRPTGIAYPYGDMGEAEKTANSAKRLGYQVGFTVVPRPLLGGQPTFEIPRYMVDRFSGRDPFTTFVLYLTCLFGTFRWYESLGTAAKRSAHYLFAVVDDAGGRN